MSDPSVLALLNGLNPSVTPVPMQINTTDGELAATFAAGARRVKPAEETPAEEASVVVRANPSPKPKGPAPERVDTTFRIRPRSGPSGLTIAIGVLVIGVVIAAWLGHSTAHTAEAPPPPPAPVVHATPPAPQIPAIPPPEPTPEPAEVLAPTAAPAPPRATAAPQKAAPTTAPTVKPTKRDPSRPKEDEPERVL